MYDVGGSLFEKYACMRTHMGQQLQGNNIQGVPEKRGILDFLVSTIIYQLLILMLGSKIRTLYSPA